MKYIFGAYGTNNVGDEAIFEGANTIYPGSIEIYVNKSSRPNSVWYADLLTKKVQFDPKADELIMGGGGLIHCRGAVLDYLKMARLAKEQGLKFSIQRVGFTELKPEYADLTKELLQEAYSISVRSQLDAEIVESLGFEAKVERDFAYEIPEIHKYCRYSLTADQKNIGVVMGTISDKDMPNTIASIKVLLKHANIVFIPHSRAWVSQDNNDLVTGHKIWSNLSLHNSKHSFNIIPEILDPSEALGLYSHLDGIFTKRYHGCIFADMTKVPLIAQMIP